MRQTLRRFQSRLSWRRRSLCVNAAACTFNGADKSIDVLQWMKLPLIRKSQASARIEGVYRRVIDSRDASESGAMGRVQLAIEFLG